MRPETQTPPVTSKREASASPLSGNNHSNDDEGVLEADKKACVLFYNPACARAKNSEDVAYGQARRGG
ncbi:MAG: hypothetical protein AMXMBFR16_00850 [Candidatus Uhrbacteria bacterium]